MTDAILFGNADWVLGTGPSEALAGSGYYWAGLGVGVAGQIALSDWAAGVTVGSTFDAGAKAYQAYSIVGDVVGIYDNSAAFANGTFTPLDALGFAPTIGWSMAGYSGL